MNEPGLRWPTLGEAVGDELYQYGASGPPCVLANGALFVEWADVLWSRFVVGDAQGIPPFYGAYADLPFVGPSVRLRIAVHNGRPEVDEVEVVRRKDCPEITNHLLSEIPLQKIKERCVSELGKAAFWAQQQRPPSGRSIPTAVRSGVDSSLGAHDPQRESEIRLIENLIRRGEAAGTSANNVRRRRVVTDDLLRKVASIYSSDLSGSPTRAVSQQLFTSHRNATRWVSLARDRGFLKRYGEGRVDE